MIGKQISKRSALVCSVAVVSLLLAGYTVMAHAQHRRNPDDRTIPTWHQLWEGVVYLCEQPTLEESDTSPLLAAALGEMGMDSEPAAEKEKRGFLQDRVIWEATKATLGRLLGGLAVGLFGGIVLGVLMGCFLHIDASLSPVMFFFSRIIPTAALPIFFKLCGIDMEMYVAMIAFGSLPIVALTVARDVQEFPDELRYKAYTLGASHGEVITTAIVPYVLPKVLNLAVMMIGPALVYLIAAEQIVAGEGFGYRIRVLTKATRFEVVYPLIVVLTVYAGVITCGLNLLRRKLCPWYSK